MTADGNRPDHSSASDAAARGEPATSIPDILLRQAAAEEDAFWETLALHEQELRDRLDEAGSDPREQRSVRADLASLHWLTSHWDAVQHNARCLKSFDQWLQTPPSRAKLFAEFCRHAIPAEWDRSLAENSPPFIFPSREKYELHLEHCQLCHAQRQLAEARGLRSQPDRPTWGDQVARDFFTTFCGDALAAVCRPSVDGNAAASSRWSEAPGLRIAMFPGERPNLRGEFELELACRLIGPAHRERYQLTITAQFIETATRLPQPETPLWPRRGEQGVIDWRPGPREGRELFLTMPAPAEPGRLVLRYAVRRAEASRGGGEASTVNALSIDSSSPGEK